ncbi:MAG: BspA family leucine-rich repeat surface protein [Oscillospiraceae bacterium]|nr:BspA family leucine-rich repeat surface protein [Oscillospiraceae bacterium]
MKKLLSIILVIVLTMTLFASCGETDKALTATELLDLGEKYLLDLDYEQAIVYFNQVIEVEPRNSRAYMGAAEAYVGLGDTESAINLLKTALDVFTDDEEVTIELLEMLIEIDPTTAEWYLDLAQIYINQGNTDKAIEVLQQGLANASDTEEIEVLLVELIPEEVEEEIVEVEPAYESNYGVLNNDMLRSPTYFDKSTITEIDFLDSLDSAPSDAWDFSLDGDGSVLGWLEGTHLYVAGDSGVVADEDASSLFGKEYGSVAYSNVVAINFNDCFDTSSVTSMYAMFYGCDSLVSLDLSSFDTSNVTNMGAMFRQCYSLQLLDVSSFDTSKVKGMGGMFFDCESLISLDLSNFNTSRVTNMAGMFVDCSSLISLNLTSFNTEKVTDMTQMFVGCESIVTLDLSSFYTPNVSSMNRMFNCCLNLVTLDISGFDTSSVEDMEMMFCLCESLTFVDFSGFDTSNVTDMEAMFEGCSSLTSLDLSNFNTSNVTDMSGMFFACTSLTTLDLSSFDTSNVTEMWGMFYNCSSLTSLDISSFDMSNADTTDMFYGTIFE